MAVFVVMVFVVVVYAVMVFVVVFFVVVVFVVAVFAAVFVIIARFRIQRRHKKTKGPPQRENNYKISPEPLIKGFSSVAI